jgi:hypothetical protein
MNWFGIYRGVCTNNSDPAGLLRIKLSIPQVLGAAESTWAWPCVPPGWSVGLLQDHSFTDNDTGDNAGGSSTETLVHALEKTTPAVGDSVWVMFEAGDVNVPVWMGVWKTNG